MPLHGQTWSREQRKKYRNTIAVNKQKRAVTDIQLIELPKSGLRIRSSNGTEILIKDGYHDQGMGHGMYGIAIFPPNENYSVQSINKGGYIIATLSSVPFKDCQVTF